MLGQSRQDVLSPKTESWGVLRVTSEEAVRLWSVSRTVVRSLFTYGAAWEDDRLAQWTHTMEQVYFGVLTTSRDTSLRTNPLDKRLSSLSSPRLVAAFLEVRGASLAQVSLVPHEEVALRILGGECFVALARVGHDKGTEAGGGQDRQRAERGPERRHFLFSREGYRLGVIKNSRD